MFVVDFPPDVDICDRLCDNGAGLFHFLTMDG